MLRASLAPVTRFVSPEAEERDNRSAATLLLVCLRWKEEASKRKSLAHASAADRQDRQTIVTGVIQECVCL